MNTHRNAIDDLIWARIEIGLSEECWEWQGAHDRRGYGYLRLSATRHVLKQKLGQELRKGLLACHTCDNPACCNPAHLYAGTYSDNMRDAIRRGRRDVQLQRGVLNGQSKLTPERVVVIRSALEAGRPIREIADEEQVDPKTIRDLRDQKTWAWVPASF